MRNVLFLVLVLSMLVFIVSACKTPSPESITYDQTEEDQLHLVFVAPLVDNPVWQAARDGFDAAAKDFNFRGDWVGPSAIDIDEMIKQIKIAIAERADGIITQGTNPELMKPVLITAHEAGIPVVVILTIC